MHIDRNPSKIDWALIERAAALFTASPLCATAPIEHPKQAAYRAQRRAWTLPQLRADHGQVAA